MKSKTYRIEGMSCNHCVMTVRKALSGVEGLEVEDVRIGEADVRIDENGPADALLRKALERAGYRVAN